MSIGVVIMTAYDSVKASRNIKRAAKLGPEFSGIVKRLAVKGGTKTFAFRSLRAATAGTIIGIVFQADEIFDYLVERERSKGRGAFGLKTTDEVRPVFTSALETSALVHPIRATKLLFTDPERFIENVVINKYEFFRDIGIRGAPAALIGGLEVSAQEFSTLVLPKKISVPLNVVLDFVL